MRRRIAFILLTSLFAGGVACGLSIQGSDESPFPSAPSDDSSASSPDTDGGASGEEAGGNTLTDGGGEDAAGQDAGPCGIGMLHVTRDGGAMYAFCIDRTEVLEARYNADFMAVDASIALPAGCAYKTSFNKGSARGGQKPVSDIDWCDAWAFCKFVGKRLCAEAEWQFACNGGIAGRTYPYGATFDASVCNGGQIGAPTDPGQMTGCASPLSPSLVDMSGNMDEWSERCASTTGPGDTCYTHGGDWMNDSAGELMCSATYPRVRSTVLGYVGFRCCKSP